MSAEDIAAGYWDAYLRLRPFVATQMGEERYDDLLPDPTALGQQAIADLARDSLAALDALTAGQRPGDGEVELEEAVTADVLRFMANDQLEIAASGWWRLASLDHMDDGPQVELVMAAQAQRADTPARLERWLRRLGRYPGYVDGHIEQADEAAGLGLLPSSVVARRVLAQLDGLLATDPAELVFVMAPPVADERDREPIRRAVVANVLPSLTRFREVVARLAAHARADPGLCAVPGGDRMYRAAIHHWTGLDVAPEELHHLGLEELERLDDERTAISHAAGFADAAAYRRALASAPGNATTAADAILEQLRADIGRARGAAPGWFGRLPRAACDVRPLDAAIAGGSLGYFLPSSPDGVRPGVFYLNTANLDTLPYSRQVTTIFHETIPGHHLQMGIAAEHPGLSAFRRQGADQCAGAMVEGWGLYAERLADEMGLFRSPAERFGMLDAQAWRAVRLVVDTGLHAFAWERDRAVEALTAATGFERADAEIEVDRYIAIPGQAVSYKVGQRTIERLRSDAAASATPDHPFDVRRFHDELLGHGPLPLEVLEARLPGWLAEGPTRGRAGDQG